MKVKYHCSYGNRDSLLAVINCDKIARRLILIKDIIPENTFITISLAKMIF